MDATTAAAWIAAVLAAGVAAYERFIKGNVWRDVAEGREQRIADLEAAVQRLESKVDALTQEFAEVIADRVVESMERRTA